MKSVLLAVQIIISILLIVLILFQARGVGFGRSLGASSSSFTRRGLERLIYKLTFIVALLFIVISFLGLFLN